MQPTPFLQKTPPTYCLVPSITIIRHCPSRLVFSVRLVWLVETHVWCGSSVSLLPWPVASPMVTHVHSFFNVYARCQYEINVLFWSDLYLFLGADVNIVILKWRTLPRGYHLTVFFFSRRLLFLPRWGPYLSPKYGLNPY